MAGDRSGDRMVFDIEFDAGPRGEIGIGKSGCGEPRTPPAFAAEARQRQQVGKSRSQGRGSRPLFGPSQALEHEREHAALTVGGRIDWDRQMASLLRV